MVEPNDANRRGGRAWSRMGLAVAVAMAAGPGCGLVPKGKMDECRRLSQTLRAENNRLKDVALDLRSQNQDLSQRAVDDSRRLAAQEEAVERLEKSVQGYQAEREQMASALEAVKRQVRLAVNPHSAAVPSRLKAFAEAHPGWSFDPASMTLSAPPDRLFAPGGTRLRPEADEALKALAGELAGAGSAGLSLEVSGPADDPGVTRAGYQEGGDASTSTSTATASGRFLSAARAARVRERLVDVSGLDPARARVAPPAGRPGDATGAAGRAVAIRLGLDDPAPALDSAKATHP